MHINEQCYKWEIRNVRRFWIQLNRYHRYITMCLQVAAETKAIISWMQRTPFVLGANLQGGENIVTYPFDMQRPPQAPSTGGRRNCNMNKEARTSSGRQNENALRETPDENMFRWLASTYAHSHLSISEMQQGLCHTDDITGGQGFINRASWKPVVGSEWENMLYLAFTVSH